MNEKSIIPNTESDKVVIVGENEQAFQEAKWNIKVMPGHILFEISLETGDAKPAEYEQTDLLIHDMGQQVNMHLQFRATGKAIGNQEIKKKLITKPNCIYISALNIQNAAKKFATQSALKWWSQINEAEKCYLVGSFYPDRNIHSIQNNEIEKLWNIENKIIKNG